MAEIAVCAVAFGSAVLAGLGVGSGGFLVVCLVLVTGCAQLEAQLLNLIFFVASSIAALAVNIIKKRLSLKVVLLLAVPGCVFSVGGAMLARSFEEKTLGKAFGGLLLLMGAWSLFSTLKKEKQEKE